MTLTNLSRLNHVDGEARGKNNDERSLNNFLSKAMQDTNINTPPTSLVHQILSDLDDDLN